MGTLRLKHIVVEKIGENVGNFKLPIVATFVVKDLVEKWGASMVEDIAKQMLKIWFVYVVRRNVTTPTFVKVVDIKVYSYVSIILNIKVKGILCQ